MTVSTKTELLSPELRFLPPGCPKPSYADWHPHVCSICRLEPSSVASSVAPFPVAMLARLSLKTLMRI